MTRYPSLSSDPTLPWRRQAVVAVSVALALLAGCQAPSEEAVPEVVGSLTHSLLAIPPVW